MARSLTVGVLPFASVLFFSRAIFATCFFPNGGISGADVPCDRSTPFSTCCFSGQACLSNKLCFDPAAGKYARGTCTDKSWNSENCPKFCLDAIDLGNPVISCNQTGTDSYCCNEGCSCTSGSAQVLSFSSTPNTLTVIGSPQTFSQSTTTTSATSSTSGSSSTSTASAVSNSSESSSTSPTSSASSKSDAVPIGVGVGVGLGVGLIAIAGVVYIIFSRKRKSRQPGMAEHGGPPAYGKTAHHYQPQPMEAQGHQVHEIGGQAATAELPPSGSGK